MSDEGRRRFSLEDPRVQAFQAAALAAEKADREKNARRRAALERKVEKARQGLQEATRKGILEQGREGGGRPERKP